MPVPFSAAFTSAVPASGANANAMHAAAIAAINLPFFILVTPFIIKNPLFLFPICFLRSVLTQIPPLTRKTKTGCIHLLLNQKLKGFPCILPKGRENYYFLLHLVSKVPASTIHSPEKQKRRGIPCGNPSSTCILQRFNLKLFKVNFCAFALKLSLDFLSLSLRCSLFDYLRSAVN